MLKITIHDSAAECRFQLQGRLEGPPVAELEQSWETARSVTAGRRTTLDLRALDASDAAGQALLDRMFHSGVTVAVPESRKRPDRRVRFAAASLVPALFLLCPVNAHAAEPLEARSTLNRYLATTSEPAQPEDTVIHMEIRARLARYGRSALARAVETIPHSGRAVFHLTAFEGDDMVKRQVIARYLTAEAEARERRDGSLAIDARNYRFRFLRADAREGLDAWVFQVEPKKKRTGLFKGELWLAADSGRVLRQSGRMVKSPSLFVRSIAFTRDYDTEGAPRSLDLHLDTRIAGAADLSVRYGPAIAADAAGL